MNAAEQSDELIAASQERLEARRLANLRYHPITRVACPYCGADVGDQCNSRGANIVAIVHKGRRVAAAGLGDDS